MTLAGVGYTYSISPTSNQIVSITTSGGTRNFFYQPHGQLTTDQRSPTSEYEYGYNYSGRLASASRNHSLLASYTYNGFEERALKAAATNTAFIYDRAGHLLEEANATTGAAIRDYIWMDDTPVAMVDDTATNPVVYDIHTDHLGRPQKLTNQAANLAWDGVFDPFGNVTSVSGSATMLLMFPGQYYDSETQLSQNWNRDFDPTIGRYVQSDPLGLRGGMNTYAYVGGNSMAWIDPLGLTWSQDASMFWDWLTGQAPENQWYGPDTNQTQDMMQAPGVQAAIAAYNKKNSSRCNGQKIPLTNYDVNFGLTGLWNAGTNSTQQFVGSYTVDVRPGQNGTINVRVDNTTSMTSFFYGIYPSSLTPPSGFPMGNASQDYSWTQKDNSSGDCDCGQ